MKNNQYSTTEASTLTGTPWYSIHRYARAGYLPTAKQVPTGKRTRWVYSKRDLEVLSAIKFYRVQGYELHMAVNLATNIKMEGE